MENHNGCSVWFNNVCNKFYLYESEQTQRYTNRGFKMKYAPILKLSSWVLNLFRKGNKNIWENILATMDVIEELIIYFNKENFISVNDKFPDNFKQPQVFLKDKQGDCDDFAKTSFEFMKRKNYKCWFVGICRSATQGHAIAVFIDKVTGFYNYTSNKKIVYNFDTFKEAVEDFYKNDTKRYEIIDKSV